MIDYNDFSLRVRTVIEKLHIETVQELAEQYDTIAAHSCIGKKSLLEIRSYCREHSVSVPCLYGAYWDDGVTCYAVEGVTMQRLFDVLQKHDVKQATVYLYLES